MDDNALIEKELASQKVFGGVLLNVYSDKVLLPNGAVSAREYIKHVGASCIVPLTDGGEVLMERQFRYPFRRVLLEIPAGKLDSKAEDPMHAALRELHEETGAYSDEVIHMYLARGLSYGDTALDEDEFITVEKHPLDELIGEIMAGKIADGKTQTALLKAYYYIQNHKD